MNEQMLQVQMLGKFAIRCGDRVISDDDDRSRKVWLLLAYLIFNRSRTFSQQDLINLCWGDEEKTSDPNNALKSVFHRVRSTLDKLGDGMGRTLILRKAGTYSWNSDVPMILDTEVFENCCRAGANDKDAEQRLRDYRHAMELYPGDLLPKLASEMWVVPAAAYYHGLYVETAEQTIRLLEEQGRIEQAVAQCRQAVAVEPYEESLYAHLIRDLVQLGDKQGAITVYEDMSELFFSNFGVMPSDELRALYREITRTVNDHAMSMEELRAQLREEKTLGGAMICEYDFFKILYRAEARAIARSGSAVHICLLSVTGKDGAPLARKSLDRAVENLEELIRINLRKGDVVAKCSASQYIIMLPRANYENSCMVADRLMNAFYRRYPHSPARVRCVVQPLEPNA